MPLRRVRSRRNAPPLVLAATCPDPGPLVWLFVTVDRLPLSSKHPTGTIREEGITIRTWPDMWYHSSQDTPDKQDAKQYKRAAVVGTGALAVLATGGDPMAGRVLADNLGRGLARMGASHTKGLGYMADVTSGDDLMAAYKEARVAIQHQAGVEKGVVRSASVLFDDPAEGERETATFEPLIDQRADALLAEVKGVYELTARQLGVTPAEPALTPAEREAANLIVEQVAGAGRGGRGGGRGGGGRGGGGRGAGGPSIPQHMSAELSILLGKGMTALEIRDFLAGEFDPLPLADLMAVLRAREAQGSIRLVPKE